MTAAIDRMPTWLWTAYGEDVDCGVPGDACLLLRHIVEEEAEIDLLDADHRDLHSLWERL